MIQNLYLFIFLVLTTMRSGATEPAYCDPMNFVKNEISLPNYDGLYRARSFQVGKVRLTGVGIGFSDANVVKNLAPIETENKKYCTLFVNSGNPQAEALFNHYYLPNPAFPLDGMYYLWTGRTVDQEFSAMLEQNIQWLVSCAEEDHYIALGCDGQKHRGPTVFGMLLAFSGCSSSLALQIVDEIWGLNGVVASTRQRLIEEAYQAGLKDPSNSQRLRESFLP